MLTCHSNKNSTSLLYKLDCKPVCHVKQFVFLTCFYCIFFFWSILADTVVSPRQKAGQSVPGNPLQTTTISTTQDGSNANNSTDASPSAISTKLYATDMASESDSTAETPPQVAKDATRTLSPSLSATSQTLRPISSRSTILSESIIRSLTTNANGNQTLPTSEVGNRGSSTSEKDYLLTHGATTNVPEDEVEPPEEMQQPRPPLDVTGSRKNK